MYYSYPIKGYAASVLAASGRLCFRVDPIRKIPDPLSQQHGILANHVFAAAQISHGRWSLRLPNGVYCPASPKAVRTLGPTSTEETQPPSFLGVNLTRLCW